MSAPYTATQFARFVDDECVRRQTSPAALAVLMGVSTRRLRSWCDGTSRPTPRVINQILAVLGYATDSDVRTRYGFPAVQEPKTRAQRNRPMFAAWLNDRLDTLGHKSLRDRVMFLSQALDTTQADVWLCGGAIPRLELLPALAEALGVDVAQACLASGRPADAATRLRYSVNPTDTLPYVLTEFKRGHGLTNATLSALTGINEFLLARYSAGSCRLTTVWQAVDLADAMSVPCAEVARLCRTMPTQAEDLDRAAQLADRPLPTLLRQARHAKGLTRAEVAVRGKMSRPALLAFEIGEKSPNLTQAIRLYKVLGVDLGQVLHLAGHAPTREVAEYRAHLLRQATRIKATGRFGAQLRRKRTRCGISQTALAEAMGLRREEFSRWEGDRSPKLETVIRIEEYLGCDGELLAEVLLQAA